MTKPDDTITLREHFERILKEMDQRYTQRFDAQEQAVSTAMAAQEKATNAAMAAAEKAVAKAETATERRLEGVNEFRKSLEDQQVTFVRQDVSEARFRNVETLIANVSSQVTETKGRGAGLNAAWGYIVAMAMAAIALLSFLKAH